MSENNCRPTILYISKYFNYILSKYLYTYPFSAGNDFRCQNLTSRTNGRHILTSIGPDVYDLKSVALKE